MVRRYKASVFVVTLSCFFATAQSSSSYSCLLLLLTQLRLLTTNGFVHPSVGISIIDNHSGWTCPTQFPNFPLSTRRIIVSRGEAREEAEEQLVSTPCTRICRYNANFYGGQVCIGCFREAFEVGAWGEMTPSERAIALWDASDRCPDSSNDGNTNMSGKQFEGAITKEELLRQARIWEKLASLNN